MIFILAMALCTLAQPGIGDHSFYRPSYHTTPEPPYYKPSSEPSYYKPAPKPTQQNCTVEDEVLDAEICTPDVETKCQEEQLMSAIVVDEQKCFQVETLECARTDTEMKIDVCSYEYKSKEKPQKAQLIEVEFEKKCTDNKVTVCKQQGYGYGGHDSYGPKCEEISQKSCYNQPKVVETQKDVVLVLPEPQLKCVKKTLSIPEVSCETKSESVCISVPRIVQQPTPVQKCVPQLSGEKCDHIQLVLPKQVCKDLIVGDAHPVHKYPPPHYSA